MKRFVVAITMALSVVFTCIPTQKAHAFVITWVIQQAIKKVVKAVDLAIQRIQTQTIKLQAAQKELENVLSKLKLGEIAAWNDSSRVIYTKYFNELAQVKDVITYYQKVKDVVNLQKDILANYKAGYNIYKNDTHFRPEEVQYMLLVYSGILSESVKNLDELTLVVSSFKTKMSDAMRLALITDVHEKMVKNKTDLQRFNNQNALLSLQRCKNEEDVLMVKRLYGIE